MGGPADDGHGWGTGIVPAVVREDADLVDLMLATAPLGFAFFGADLRCRSVNDALARTTGRSRAAHVG